MTTNSRATAAPGRDPNPFILDVLVVGAGPAGLTTAIGAARHGARVLVVERHPSTTVFPRATGVDTRTMEIFRSWGLARRIRAGAIAVRPLSSTSRTIREADPVGSPIGYPLDPRVTLAVSPTVPACCPQDHIEPVLLEHVRALGVEVRFDTELTGLVDHGTGVHAQLLDRTTAAMTRVRARYAVGADGPRSTVRELVRIPVDRLGSLGPYTNIVFHADLDPVLGPRRYPLYFLGEGRPPSVVFPLGRGRWGYVRPGELPHDQPLDELAALVRETVGVAALVVRILARLPFEMAADLARSFRSGNVFLVGDAAHRMTPRGALGMNTAIQGAHNLGWKLGWVSRGRAGAALLDSYESERRSPAEHNARQSVRAEMTAPQDRVADDLGVRYASEVVASDPMGSDSAPGTRAPHVWLHDGRGRCSTLDLFDGRLTLLAGDGEPRWRPAAARCGAPVQVLCPGEQHRDTAERLRARYALVDRGAVLVRPDGYIAWRCQGAADPKVALRAAVAMVLGRTGPVSVDRRRAS